MTWMWPSLAHVPAEITEKRRDGIVVKVMQQAVDEDEVIRPLSWNGVGADVCDLEVRAVPSSRMCDVRRVEIDAEVVETGEFGAVRSWAAAHVQHAPNRGAVVVAPHWSELRRDEGALPRQVDAGPLEQSDDGFVH